MLRHRGHCPDTSTGSHAAARALRCKVKDEPVGGANKDMDKDTDRFMLSAGAEQRR